jgi:hypothetical protein
MKIFIILLCLLFLNGCATNPNDGMIPRIYSYLPADTKRELQKKTPAAFQDVVNSGFQKLDIADLYLLNHYKLQIIETSYENCLVMINDKAVSSVKKEVILAGLPPADYDQYAKIMAKAMSLGVNDDIKAPARINKKEFDRAFDTALDSPTAGSLPKYFEKLKISDQDQCALFHKGLSYVDQKRNRIAEIIVRYLGI